MDTGWEGGRSAEPGWSKTFPGQSPECGLPLIRGLPWVSLRTAPAPSSESKGRRGAGWGGGGQRRSPEEDGGLRSGKSHPNAGPQRAWTRRAACFPPCRVAIGCPIPGAGLWGCSGQQHEHHKLRGWGPPTCSRKAPTSSCPAHLQCWQKRPLAPCKGEGTQVGQWLINVESWPLPSPPEPENHGGTFLL